MHRVAVLALDQVVAFDLAIPCEVFGLARLADGSPGYQTRVCGARTIAVTGGVQPQFRMSPPWPLAEAAHADTIVVPGLADINLIPSARVRGLLRAAAGRGTRVASVCTGAFVLAAAGLLDGRRATTHWEGTAELARRYPHIRVDPGVLYVDNDGLVLTSAGLAAGLDMCLHMVDRDYGAAVAAATARRVVVPLVRDGGQAQFIEYTRPGVAGPGLGETLAWMEANLHHALTLEDIARHAATSVRSLTRHFHDQVGMTPMQHLLLRRIQRAKELLETTDLPIERLCEQAGFGSAVALRQQFTRRVKVSPQRYRAAFRTREAGRQRNSTPASA
jgi:transcriptional regulator GlxA family with amidase domain